MRVYYGADADMNLIKLIDEPDKVVSAIFDHYEKRGFEPNAFVLSTNPHSTLNASIAHAATPPERARYQYNWLFMRLFR